MTSNIFAADVSLTWNKNIETDLAGYHIYQRLLPSSDYGTPVFSGFPSNPNAPQKTITNLLPDSTYGFIATAFDTSGNESSTSNESITTTPSEGGSGNQAPTVSAGANQTTTLPSNTTLNGTVTISNLQPASYAVVPASPGLQHGSLVYIDRSYTFTSVPASVQGVAYIQTANRDKYGTANPFLSFTVDQPVTIYVAHDGRVALPVWLTNMGFTDTGENVGTTDTPRDLFAQTFPAGAISLGGNESGGSMYSVIVKATSGGDPTNQAPTVSTGANQTTTLPSNSTLNGTVTISNLQPAFYAVVPASPGLQDGSLVYIDRSYTFTSVPASVQGVAYIQTANRDKYGTANPFLSFTVDQPVTIYVAHDRRLALPVWLTNMGFTDTGENVGTTDTPRDLFTQTFPAGAISLGGNESGGSMYSVIVKASGSDN